jgi:succinyl-CoA synthetase beta subunit
MKLMEYQAREMFDSYGIAVMNGITVSDVDDIEMRLVGLRFPLVVKAQVQVGGRGKAGGIKFAEDIDEVKEIAGKMLGGSIKGHKVNQLLIVEKADGVKELYVSIVLDRLTKCPMIIFSSAGGVDIEETAEKNPEAIIKLPINPLIGINRYHAYYIVNRSGIDKQYVEQLFNTLLNMYRLYMEKDAVLVEINPLLVDSKNQLIALDGKVDIDDSALYRQPLILKYRDSIQEEALVVEARKYRLLYIPVEESGDIGVISNGSGMLMSSIDLISKAGMSVAAVLDLGGGATADRIKEATRIVLENPHVKQLFINIFGGITRCNEVAAGIESAMKEQPPGKRIIARLEGTNKEIGIEMLKKIEYDVISVDGLSEGVAELSNGSVRS